MLALHAYFFHTVGELCLSPVGLSSMTKLAPGRLVGQMMGAWFMGAAIGNLVGPVLVTRFVPRPRRDRGGHPERRAALRRGRGDFRRVRTPLHPVLAANPAMQAGVN